MQVLEVSNLTKRYPAFLLDSVSFSLEKGHIMGFIGRNGAGKTTTLKSIFNLVHPDSGEVRCFGLEMRENEREVKQRVGFAGGAVDYYKHKKIRDIIDVTRSFYANWDESEYRHYLSLFSLDESKTPLQLSEGMRVKLSLTLSLSHHAELLILDEPTSGLDPVSRAELLDVFLYLKNRGVSILFSTHITTDLEKCADDIAYIAKGRLIHTGSLRAFLEESAANGIGASLEDIMVYHEKERLL
ncbi:MAG: ABC transporter ATP-binding protein [Clostridia bacterium]|nr:ABC transporter ATP-binding protein [Clostridia bacterium]